MSEMNVETNLNIELHSFYLFWHFFSLFYYINEGIMEKNIVNSKYESLKAISTIET